MQKKKKKRKGIYACVCVWCNENNLRDWTADQICTKKEKKHVTFWDLLSLDPTRISSTYFQFFFCFQYKTENQLDTIDGRTGFATDFMRIASVRDK